MKLLSLLWSCILWFRQGVFVCYMVILTTILASLAIFFNLLHLPIYIKIFPAKLWSMLIRWGMLIFLWLHVKIEGQENLSKKPCVYICKHQSAWETIILHGVLHNICFVLKEELLKIPLFGTGLKAIDSIQIDRKKNLQSLKKILKIGKKRLNAGLSIVIFPEGTRVNIGEYPKFHKTATLLAKSTNSTIIPIAHNSGKFWPNKSGLIKPGTITLSFGKRISANEFFVDELNQYCYQWINEKVKTIGG